MPNFVVIPRGQRIARPKQLKFPILVKPVKEEASYGISQASFVETDEQFRERVAFIHEKHDSDVIAEEYIEGRELYVSLMGNLRLTVFPIRELVFREVPPDEPKIATYRAKWDEEYRKRWGLQNQFAEELDPALVARIEADVQTHLSSAHDRWLRAHRPAADGRQRDLFHRGEPKSDSGGGRGLRAVGGQGGPALSAIDRSDHPAGDEYAAGLRLVREFGGTRAVVSQKSELTRRSPFTCNSKLAISGRRIHLDRNGGRDYSDDAAVPAAARERAGGCVVALSAR